MGVPVLVAGRVRVDVGVCDGVRVDVLLVVAVREDVLVPDSVRVDVGEGDWVLLCDAVLETVLVGVADAEPTLLGDVVAAALAAGDTEAAAVGALDPLGVDWDDGEGSALTDAVTLMLPVWDAEGLPVGVPLSVGVPVLLEVLEASAVRLGEWVVAGVAGGVPLTDAEDEDDDDTEAVLESVAAAVPRGVLADVPEGEPLPVDVPVEDGMDVAVAVLLRVDAAVADTVALAVCEGVDVGSAVTVLLALMEAVPLADAVVLGEAVGLPLCVLVGEGTGSANANACRNCALVGEVASCAHVLAATAYRHSALGPVLAGSVVMYSTSPAAPSTLPHSVLMLTPAAGRCAVAHAELQPVSAAAAVAGAAPNVHLVMPAASSPAYTTVRDDTYSPLMPEPGARPATVVKVAPVEADSPPFSAEMADVVPNHTAAPAGWGYSVAVR